MPHHSKESMNAEDSHSDMLPDVNNLATIALLEQWAAEDATDDPATMEQAERELADFKAALNANRPADRPLFP